MPQLTDIEGRFRYSIERFDGGQNVKDSPSRISPFETPDSLNVVFDLQGAATTRNGSKAFNTTVVAGTATVDAGIQYGTQQVIWTNGKMWYSSSLTATTYNLCTTSSGRFTAGTNVAATVFQNVLFCSDGTNGPWKWTGGENFYNMGINIPSAPTGASSGAGSIATGTYYYAVSNINTQVVEGQIGSVSVGVTTTNSSTIQVTQIPVGTSLAGVNQRFIYRADAASGPFRKVGTIADNTTTTFNDSVANGAEGKLPVFDGSAPTPFTTIQLSGERLFFDDSTNRSFLRFTEFNTPYISVAEDFEPINNGDGENIIAISAQDAFLTIFKKNRSWSILLQDPSDFTTWIKRELPGNIGIVGPRAFTSVENGIAFVGQRNNRITGVHLLSGLQLIETNDGKMRSESISSKIEPDILPAAAGTGFDASYWSNCVLQNFNNRLYLAYTKNGDTFNKNIYWFDLNRVGTDRVPGSWAPWDGIHAKCLFTCGGNLFAGDADATGVVRQLEITGVYSDSGSAINSYYYTKEIGGDDDTSLDGYIKDLREIYVWYGRQGNYNMNLRFRVDGDTSLGTTYPISLNPGSGLWGTMIWGSGVWGGARTDFITRVVVGRTTGRKFQLRFDNQNTVNQSFKVHRVELGMNLRRRR